MFFSIIVPVYNAEKFVERLLKSIIEQSFEDFELLLVNDGSTDNSAAILNKWQKDDSRIIVTHKKNGGVSSARNEGLKQAKGKYIMFADADDVYEPGAFRVLYEKLKALQVDFLCFGYEEYKIMNGVVQARKKCAYPEHFYNGRSKILENELFLIEHTMFGTVWSKVYRASIITKYGLRMEEEIFIGEDYCFNLLFLQHCEEFLTIQNSLYMYYIENENSIIRRYNSDKFEQMYKVHRMKTEYIQKNTHIDEVEKEISIQWGYIRLCMSYFMDFSRKECKMSFGSQYREIKEKMMENKSYFKTKYLTKGSLLQKILHVLFAVRAAFLVLLISKCSFFIKFKLKKSF